MRPPTDHVDQLIEQWRRERPDLNDLDAMATFGRLGRLMTLATASIESTFAAHGLTIGEFDVLAALRRSGAPFETRPTDLAKLVMLSPAGMTTRLDRLEAAGHVERRIDRADRRSWRIRLTDAGRAVVDDAVDDHVANEAELLRPLSGAERKALDQALRKLLGSFEPPDLPAQA